MLSQANSIAAGALSLNRSTWSQWTCSFIHLNTENDENQKKKKEKRKIRHQLASTKKAIRIRSR